MIRTVIVDDEPLARRGVAVLLASQPGFVVVGECRNGVQAVSTIIASQPDLVLLDIQMPGMNGFDVLSSLSPHPVPAIIFLTAYDEYALAAFDVQALDYLLKPIDEDRFACALSRVREMLELKQIAAQRRSISGLIEIHKERQSEGPTKRFVVRERGRVFFVSSDDVDWIEAVGDYAGLHIGKRTHLLRESLTELEARLDSEKFARIHRSSIVALDRVVEMQARKNRDWTVTLRDGQSLNVSRTYSGCLRAAVRRRQI
jgi:two-component system, LytTR family, response regulator